MNRFKKIITVLVLIVIIIGSALFLLSITPMPEKIIYGSSFSKLHASELSLDWKKVFIASLDELGIRHFRLSAHWPNTEPENNKYNFADLDFQINEAKRRGADVILGVGRRLPGWPECHEPQWAHDLNKDQKQKELLEYVETVVNRYKDYPNLLYWQVENEPFLAFFAHYHCQDFLDEDFFEKEIALVKTLDPETPIFITDSGELSLWYHAYTRADVFGTSMYLYVWNHTFGPVRYPIYPAFFRIKHNIVNWFADERPAVISELSAEPWLLAPIAETPIDVQLSRMDLKKFNEIISFAKKTGFDTQYLWGVEWWYWMKEKGHPEFWEKAKEVYRQ